jgi:glyoxylase-like metal-dependent hydrolase (beta-lactamase superfamily II)
MLIKTLTVGPIETNCYIVTDEKTRGCVVIDPGAEAAVLLNYLEENRLNCHFILLTHGHFDHVGGVRAIADAARCPVRINEKDLALPPFITNGKLCYTDLLKEGATVQVGKLFFTVLETPGHTPGSVCLRCGNALFSGDTLFAGGCGRTDLPGGSAAELRESLKRLAAIPENLTVLPGHGEATTLDRERGWIR